MPAAPKKIEWQEKLLTDPFLPPLVKMARLAEANEKKITRPNLRLRHATSISNRLWEYLYGVHSIGTEAGKEGYELLTQKLYDQKEHEQWVKSKLIADYSGQAKEIKQDERKARENPNYYNFSAESAASRSLNECREAKEFLNNHREAFRDKGLDEKALEALIRVINIGLDARED